MQKEQFELHAALEEKHWWFVARRKIMKRLIRDLLPPHEKKRILDVGCGTGANIASLAYAYDCVGIDVSKDAIENAQRRFPGVQFSCSTLQSIDEHTDKKPDLITMMDVLEHVEDDFVLLSQALQQLDPGGLVFITVPADPSLWSEHDVSFEHYRRYTKKRLQRLLDAFPIAPLLVSHYNTHLFPIVKTVRTIGQIRKQAANKDGTDFQLPPWPINQALIHTFASESNILIRALRTQSQTPYRVGVSLIAVLQLERPLEAIVHKPADIEPDLHNPAKHR